LELLVDTLWIALAAGVAVLGAAGLFAALIALVRAGHSDVRWASRFAGGCAALAVMVGMAAWTNDVREGRDWMGEDFKMECVLADLEVRAGPSLGPLFEGQMGDGLGPMAPEQPGPTTMRCSRAASPRRHVDANRPVRQMLTFGASVLCAMLVMAVLALADFRAQAIAGDATDANRRRLAEMTNKANEKFGDLIRDLEKLQHEVGQEREQAKFEAEKRATEMEVVSRLVADLFRGIGTFAIAIARRAEPAEERRVSLAVGDTVANQAGSARKPFEEALEALGLLVNQLEGMKETNSDLTPEDAASLRPHLRRLHGNEALSEDHRARLGELYRRLGANGAPIAKVREAIEECNLVLALQLLDGLVRDQTLWTPKPSRARVAEILFPVAVAAWRSEAEGQREAAHDALAALDLRLLVPRLQEMFDPKRHRVAKRENSVMATARGQVLRVIEPGLLHKEAVVRPAQVVLSA
jgi:hypothetical protein